MSFLNSNWSQKLYQLPWGVIAAFVGLGLFSMMTLYSAAGGNLMPWAIPHGLRFFFFLGVALVFAYVPLRKWLDWSYAIYFVVLIALLGVEVMGKVAGGAQRWLDLGIMRLQPSELMKVAIVLVMARYYHQLPKDLNKKLVGLWPPLVFIALPVSFVLLQPDLGTSLILIAGGLVMLFLGGIPLSWLLVPGGIFLASIPFLYSFALHPYQQRRIMTFLDPESDPLGAGYHITQSKIAIGSGGIFGKGYMQGSQSHLQYLPEQHTDFAFSAMAEEWGLVGGIALISVFLYILNWGLRISRETQSVYGRLTIAGLSMAIFFYILVNAMMVMGMAPVVGLPFPILSYGGSAMMTVMIAFGIMMSVYRQRDLESF